MAVVDVENLVLTALLPEPDPPGERVDDASEGPRRSVREVLTAVGGDRERLSRQVEVAGAIDRLVDAGWVRRETAADGGQTLSLTGAGRARADAARDDLARTTVDFVLGDDRRRLTLREIAAEVDRSLTAVAAKCASDGTYHVQDGPTHTSIVGREEYRRVWPELLEEVRADGRGRVVVLSGPGGIGKTTLAEDLETTAEDAGFDVRRTRCHGTGSDAFQPIEGLLTGLDTEGSPFDEPLPAIEDESAFEARQTSLFRDLLDELAPTGADPPRVCVVDDLHLADAATNAFLAYAFDACVDRRLVLLGTERPDERPDSSPLADDLERFDTEVVRFELEPLDPPNTARVVERVLDRRGVPEAFVDAVHRRTGGNPLFVEATVEALLERGRLDPAFEWYPTETDELGVPDRIRETITDRVGHLDDPARSVLEWAAVVGESVPIDVLERTCELSVDRLATTVEVLVQAGVFDRGDGGDSVSFRGEVLREAMLEELDERTRRDRHARVAAAFEATTDRSPDDSIEDVVGVSFERTGTTADETWDERAAAIAHHLEAAGDRADAIEWYGRAGRRAMRIYAHETAIDQFDRALELAVEENRESAVRALGEQLAMLSASVGDYDRSDRFVRFVRERTPEGETERRQRLLRLEASNARARGAHETAHRAVDEALSMDDEPTPLRCWLLLTRAILEWYLGDYEEADDTIRRQQSMADDLDHPSLRAQGLNQRARIARCRDEYDRAARHLDRALDTFESIGHTRRIAETHEELGNVALLCGDEDEARTHYRTAREGYEATGSGHRLASVTNNLAITHRDAGNHDRARSLFATALSEFESYGDAHQASLSRLNLGAAEFRLGHYDRARRLLDRAIDELETVGNRHHLAIARLRRGQLNRVLGQLDRVAEHVETARSIFDDVDDRKRLASCQLVEADLLIDRGRYDRARECVDRAESTVRDIGRTDRLGRVRLLRGRLDRLRGAFGSARDRFTAAAERAGETDDHTAARARRQLGILERQCGRYGVAREHLERALETLPEDDDVRRACCRVELAAVARCRDDDEVADNHLTWAETVFEAHDHEFGRGVVALYRGRIALDRGADDTARERIDGASSVFDDLECPLWSGRVSQARGSLCARQSSLERARECWQSALDSFEALGAIPDALATLECLVDAAIDAGDEDGATRWCRHALSLATADDVDVPDDDLDRFRSRCSDRYSDSSTAR